MALRSVVIIPSAEMVYAVRLWTHRCLETVKVLELVIVCSPFLNDIASSKQRKNNDNYFKKEGGIYALYLSRSLW